MLIFCIAFKGVVVVCQQIQVQKSPKHCQDQRSCPVSQFNRQNICAPAAISMSFRAFQVTCNRVQHTAPTQFLNRCGAHLALVSFQGFRIKRKGPH